MAPRQHLKKINHVRKTFTGTFLKKGIKSGFKGPLETILLADIKDESGKVVTDHLWFNLTKGFKDADLKTDDEVQFDARVKSYKKGYRGRQYDGFYTPPSTDYKLSHPSKVKNLTASQSSD